MFLGWEAFGFHIFDVISERLLHFFMEISILFDEFGRETIEQSKYIMSDQHLTITAHACANAYGGNGNLFRDQLCQSCRDRFKHDAKTTSFFENLRIFQETFCSDGSFALCAESAKLVDGLRCKSEMSHHWDACIGDRVDGVLALASAF